MPAALEDAWREYYAAFAAQDPTISMAVQMRRAFFAGGTVVLGQFLLNTEALTAELAQFAEDLRNGKA